MSTLLAETLLPQRRLSEDYLPESDGKPMAETDPYRHAMIYALDALEEHFRDRPDVYVTGNIFLYYRNDFGELVSVAPDIFVVKGVEKKARRIYHLEKEGKAPEVVIELISRETKLEDLGNKRVLYAGLGVREYFIFDPVSEVIGSSLRGFRLQGDEYVPLMGARLHSAALSLDLIVAGQRLRLYDRKRGEYLRSHGESEADRRVAEAKAEQEASARRAAEAKAEQEVTARRAAETKVEQETAARLAAEAEIVRLREALGERQSNTL